MDILADHRWNGRHGIGRFAAEVIARLPDARPLPSKRHPLHPLNAFEVARVLRRERPDVYFTPGFNPPRKSAVPFVFCIHDLIHLQCREESSLAKRLYYRAIVRPAGFQAARVLTVSQYSRDAILDWSGWPAERVTVVGNGVGEAFCPQGSAFSAGYPYLLHVGNHKPHKNVDRLLTALALARLDEKIRLIFVARQSPAIRRQIRKRNLQSRVVFINNVDDALLAELYRGALACVLPSLHEGFGLPAAESMACGTPLACAEAAALPEVTAGAALLFDPRDVDAIAAALERIVTDTSLRRQLSRRGLDRARDFSWESTATRVHDVLRQAVPL